MALALARACRRGALSFRSWDDGSEQYVYPHILEQEPDREYEFLAIERVVSPKSKRKNWMIVTRGNDEDGQDSTSKYPPKIAGPFKSLRQAKKVYQTICALRGLL